jgi:hypothetical protein
MKLWKTSLIPFLPVVIQYLGYGMNAVVTAANKGQMPVRVPGGGFYEIDDIAHILMSSHTHLNFLADWITMNSGVGSPGDWLMNTSGDFQIPAILAWLSVIIYEILRRHNAHS